jgi:hypothetical protein
MISRNVHAPAPSRRAKRKAARIDAKTQNRLPRSPSATTGVRRPQNDGDARALELWELRFDAIRAREEASEDAGDDEMTALNKTLSDIEDAIDALDPAFPCAAAAQLMIAGLFEISDEDRPGDDPRMEIAIKGLAGLREQTHGRIRADVDEILDSPERPICEMGVLFGADTPERRRAARLDRFKRLIVAAECRSESAEYSIDSQLIALGRAFLDQVSIPTSDRRFSAAHNEAARIMNQIVAERALGLAGVRIKAFALAWTYDFEEFDLIADFGDTPIVRLLKSIVRDLLRS